MPKLIARNYTEDQPTNKTFEEIVSNSGNNAEKTNVAASFWDNVAAFIDGQEHGQIIADLINSAMGYDIAVLDNTSFPMDTELSVLTNFEKNVVVIRVKEAEVVARIAAGDIEREKFMRKLSHRLGWLSDPVGTSYLTTDGSQGLYCTIYHDTYYYGDEEAPDGVSNVYNNDLSDVDKNSRGQEALEDDVAFVSAEEFSRRFSRKTREEGSSSLEYVEAAFVSPENAAEARSSRLQTDNVLSTFYGLHNNILVGSLFPNKEIYALPSLIDDIDDEIDKAYRKVSDIISDQDKRELRGSVLHAQKLLNDLRSEPETMLLGDSIRDIAYKLNTGEIFNVRKVYRGPVILDLVYAMHYADLAYDEDDELEMFMRNYRIKSKHIDEQQNAYVLEYAPKYLEVLDTLSNLKERANL